jgi:hypothetical protein
MTNMQTHSGWVRLKNGFDVELVNGIPVTLSNNGLTIAGDDAALDDEISTLSGLRTTIVGWHDCENSDEQETSLCIDAAQFEEVLQRLAIASAGLFVNRFHKPVGKDAVDWDKMEYDSDFNKAIEHCCLESTDYNKMDFFDMYRDCMHIESHRLIEDGISPIVGPE